MNFSFFSLITSYLFAFALAAPQAVDESAIAKRSVSGEQLVSHINGLVTSVKQLNTYASHCKAGKTGASQDFHSLANSCSDAATSFKNACGGYANPLFPAVGLVTGILQLIACIVDLVVNLGLWVIVVGIELVFDIVKLVVLLVLDILRAIELIINGGNWAFWGASWPCQSAISLCENFCKLHGISY